MSSPERNREKARTARADGIHPVSVGPPVYAAHRMPLRPQAHGKCGSCGSTVMTAQDWWQFGHQSGRCLRPARSFGMDEFNALFC